MPARVSSVEFCSVEFLKKVETIAILLVVGIRSCVGRCTTNIGAALQWRSCRDLSAPAIGTNRTKYVGGKNR